MAKPIGLGIVGCGHVMQNAYMPLVSSLANEGLVEVVAACDVKDEAAEMARRRFGIPRFHADYRDIARSDDVELVLVLTSMPEHGPITRAALEAGKNVMVEKPMAVTLKEAGDLVALSNDCPGYLVCAPHVILSPTYQAVWRHLRRGDVGRLNLARARYGWAGPTWGPWFYRSGGGPLFDLAVYNITSLTGWLGPAQRVMAMTGTAIPERLVEGEWLRVDTEDNYQILIDFGDAVFASVTSGFCMQKYRSPAIELYGSEGTIQMMGDDWAPEGYEIWQNDVGAWKVFGETAPQWRWTDGLRHLIDCINEGVAPIIKPEHAYHVLEIMLEAIESGRDGRDRQIESTFTPPIFDLEEEGEAAHLVHDRAHST